MVRTAASIFSPDTGGPLRRRKRERFPTTVETYSTRVEKVERVTPTIFYWYFTQNSTEDGPNSPQLVINGQSPYEIAQSGPKRIIAQYASPKAIGAPWTIDATPENIIFDPPCKVPQSGTVE